ncbi:protein phosphatase PHLPP-like protein [Musca domestica]|uniref:Protein phosphatase PHLPP-like protein n=1 Tax=Musca domestica TaxID=7370 RepID=A0A9J7DEG7_MUSDO|nr:protein phosphatase PHLPP-like protein [Musca domestica]
MIKATKILTKPSADLYQLKLNKMKSNEKNNENPKNEEALVCTNSDSLASGASTIVDQQQQQQQPLKKFSLKGNQLSGSILIGNYNYLTQLEVSENEMEVLDLSSLAQLETLKCSHNKLLELMINGSNLTSLVADSNCLHLIHISPLPNKLYHVNISNNYFTELPKWLNECEMLETLDASHNQLQKVTDFLLTGKTTRIRQLNLSYNNLRIIERLSERFRLLEELQLHSNELQLLTDNLFAITKGSLKLLNLSSNKLQILPPIEEKDLKECEFVLERLLVTGNNLDDRIFEVLKEARNLRVLYAAYNKISAISEDCLQRLGNLEELMLSGNLLQHLPESICELKNLQVLRVHSNLLLSTPALSKITTLRVLDLAHNHLDHLDLMSLVPQNLKYLDLSCNLQLQVDEQQVNVCRSQRKWSLVDVSGKNRINLPTKKSPESKDIHNGHKPPWFVGFSETPGKCRKLLVIQLREGKFRTDEALFGMFISGSNTSSHVCKMAQMLPKLLQQERMVKENMGDYMKYTLLAGQQKLSDKPPIGSLLCHISRENTRPKFDMVRPQKTKRYVLRVASMGDIGAYLIRRTNNIQLIARPASLKSVQNASFSDPSLAEWILGNDDEYLVICNPEIRSVLDIDRIAREVRKEENVVLAAKRVQDMAQSFGAQGNLSVIVIRFKNIGTDVDYLIKELKQTVRRKPQSLVASPVNTGLLPNVCKRACCDRSLNCRHRFAGATATKQLPSIASRIGSDRSSPSGQSDPALSVANPKQIEGDNEYILAHARVLEETTEMEMLDETDSALSEEQFKCWEYMLEQNTQLLFDKELNTISKSFTKNRNAERKRSTPERYDYKSNLLKTSTPKFISTSSPQLLYSEVKKGNVGLLNPAANPLGNPSSAGTSTAQQSQVSFLSKHFGSARSFGTAYNFFTDSKSRDSLASGIGYSKLSGGPNAAYFGSLQRLMPYNLEYDFAVTQERNYLDEDEDDDDFNDHEHRMRKYWGVATTEL